MKRPWLGYLSAALLLLGGIFQIIGGNMKIGILFIVLAIVSVFLQVGMTHRDGSSS